MRYILFKDTLSWGDAASNDCLEMHRILKKNSKESMICSINKNFYIKDFVALEHLSLTAKDTIILHSLNSEKILQFIQHTPAKKILRYHNITPPEYFEFWNHNLFKECQKELTILEKYKNLFHSVLAVSEFNKNHLKELEFDCPIGVLPFLINFDYLKNSLFKKNGNMKNILFTGRVAPNKKHEDILKSFAYYQKYYNQNSQLFLIGGSPCPFYTTMLKRYAQELNIQNLYFTGEKCTQNDLLLYYKKSDLFLCLSEHEGFCVPLLEAMFLQKPILAYNIPAVAETLNESGILLNDKNPLLVAGVINRILTDLDLKNKIIQKQNERLNDFTLEKLEKIFMNKINQL